MAVINRNICAPQSNITEDRKITNPHRSKCNIYPQHDVLINYYTRIRCRRTFLQLFALQWIRNAYIDGFLWRDAGESLLTTMDIRLDDIINKATIEDLLSRRCRLCGTSLCVFTTDIWFSRAKIESWGPIDNSSVMFVMMMSYYCGI